MLPGAAAKLDSLVEEISKVCDQISTASGARIMLQDISMLWHSGCLTARGLELRLRELKEYEDARPIPSQTEIDASERIRLALIVGVPSSEISDEALNDLRYGPDDDAVRQRWAASLRSIID